MDSIAICIVATTVSAALWSTHPCRFHRTMTIIQLGLLALVVALTIR